MRLAPRCAGQTANAISGEATRERNHAEMRRHPVCACLMTDADYPANFKSCDRRHKHWLPAFLPSMGLIRFRAIPDPRGSKILRTSEPGSAGARAAPYMPIPLAATISKASPRRASCSLLANLNSVFQRWTACCGLCRLPCRPRFDLRRRHPCGIGKDLLRHHTCASRPARLI